MRFFLSFFMLAATLTVTFAQNLIIDGISPFYLDGPYVPPTPKPQVIIPQPRPDSGVDSPGSPDYNDDILPFPGIGPFNPPEPYSPDPILNVALNISPE